MRISSLSLASAVSAAIVLATMQGCVMPLPDKLNGDPSGERVPSGDPGSDPGPGGSPGGDPQGGGLPCEVSELLAARCQQCHGTTPVGGALTSLMTYEDLLAPMPNDASTTVAEGSLVRMRAAASPMPPGALPPAAEVDPFAAWVAAGLPSEVCDTTGGATGGGSGGTDPYDTPAVCTSDTYWTQGDEGSGDMLPGSACDSCHKSEGPKFLFAGTVYPTAHEPDDCNGFGGAQIEITDANGQVLLVNARSSGNFSKGGDPATLAMPITARVLYEGKVLAMATPFNTGDCNSCHTQDGADGAPGRIILPP